jgi:hypothetical protein
MLPAAFRKWNNRWLVAFANRAMNSNPSQTHPDYRLARALISWRQSVSCTIHFNRPETPYDASTMFVGAESDLPTQIRYVQRLGYLIVDGPPRTAGHLSVSDQGRIAPC